MWTTATRAEEEENEGRMGGLLLGVLDLDGVDAGALLGEAESLALAKGLCETSDSEEER